MLDSRLRRRMRALGIGTLRAYEALLTSRQGGAELHHFLDAVTTNTTEFFREAQHFQLLSAKILPSLAAARGQAGRCHVSVWCAGCSTGQEAYSLAMVLSDFARARAGFTFSLVATDISTRVLACAARGIYAEKDTASVSATYRRQFLLRSKDPSKGLVRVAPELRKSVRFERLNFMDQEYRIPGPFDLIFFRNVMIYFDRPTQQAVVRRQCRLLRPGCYLFVGHSESVTGLDVPLETVASSVFRKLGG